MNKSPAFQMYSNDFLVDTLDWSIEEIGIYTRLLFYQWTNGSIPDDTKRLARIAGCGTQKFIANSKKVLSKFVKINEGYLQNERMEFERLKQAQYIENQREKGKKRAEERWTGHIAVATKRLQPEGKPKNASSSSSSLKETSLKDFATFSEKWWHVYPSRNGKKVGKKESLLYLKSMKLENGDRELLLKATQNYSTSKAALEGYIKDPVRFLKKEFWRDWVEPEERNNAPPGTQREGGRQAPAPYSSDAFKEVEKTPMADNVREFLKEKGVL
jgi:uncharacterized protein YdaU (DUF1376 family)